MPQHDIKFSFAIQPDRKVLSIVDQHLLSEADRACKMAYAPYSKFNVGAAIRTVADEIILGSNQENESFPIGQCAERVALYSMVHSIGRKPIDTIAIVVDHSEQKIPASPCGSCRQILCEYRRHQETPIRLLLALADGGEVYEIYDVPDLLPFAFDGSFLGW